ncbi:hypothetical protein GCM10009623_15450 [Nocardioides aestuarii]|uniref:TIGR04255 family protein n=1 Tax=Nocardioides aestuarii TaxID=252231 RepID=A0ABW4TK47_9ACTN
MLKLPQADHSPLPSPALPLVVAQARYSPVRAEVTAEVVAAIQHRLRETVAVDLSRVAPLMSTDIVIGPGVTVPPQVQHGMQLSAEDGQWQATVTPEWVSLETPSFRSYAEDFRPVWGEVLGAVSDALAPVTVMRAGLRFVNVLKPPVELAAGAPVATCGWDRWIRGSLAGPAGDEWLLEGALAYSQQMLVESGQGVRSGVRSGPVENEDRPAFLLDIDTFSEPQAVWAVDDVVALFERLNGCGVALFQELVTPEMLNHLRGSEAAGGHVRGKDLL